MQAPKLWRALHDLILLDMLGYPRSRPAAQLDELWRRVDCEGTAPMAVAFVQDHLGCLGYPSEDIYLLTPESDKSRCADMVASRRHLPPAPSPPLLP